MASAPEPDRFAAPREPASRLDGPVRTTGADDAAEAEARIARVERLLQSEAVEDAAALAEALRATETSVREAAPATRAWYRAQVSRALVLYALADPRRCDVARVVPTDRARDAVRDRVVRTMFEQLRVEQCN